MTNEQAIKLLQHCGAEAHCRHFIATDNCDGCNMMTALNMAIEALSAEADRPTGEWVRKYDKQINCYWYECNQCGEYRPRNVFGNEWSSPYCPNCGAKMYKDGEE